MNLYRKKNQSINSLFSAFLRTIGLLFFIVAIGLLLDSKYGLKFLQNRQNIAAIGGFLAFSVMFYRSTSRVREQMLYALVIGFLGEHLFSIVFGMYTYRLGNIPLYVPFGHAILLRVVIHFCKKPAVIFHTKQIEKWITIFILIYSFLFLLYANDVLGFIMSLLVIILLINRPKERLFYLSMYVVVAYLEIIGTTYQCWSWPKVFCGTFPFLKSANPPSGISLFYFLLDISSFLIYKQRHILAWKRLKKIQKSKEANLTAFSTSTNLNF